MQQDQNDEESDQLEDPGNKIERVELIQFLMSDEDVEIAHARLAHQDFRSKEPDYSKDCDSHDAKLGIVAVAVFGIIGLLAPEVLMGKASVSYLYIFIAHQKLYEFNALDLIARVLQLVGFLVVLVLLHLGTTEAVWCFVLVTIVSGIIYLVQTRKVTPLALRFDPTL